MTNRQKIGSVIRRHRKLAKLSFRALGRSTGIYYGTLRSLEIGRGKLDATQLALLTQVLGAQFAQEVFRVNTPKVKKASAR